MSFPKKGVQPTEKSNVSIIDAYRKWETYWDDAAHDGYLFNSPDNAPWDFEDFLMKNWYLLDAELNKRIEEAKKLLKENWIRKI